MLENDPKSRIYPIIRKEQILVKKSQLLIGQIKKIEYPKSIAGTKYCKENETFWVIIKYYYLRYLPRIAL